MPTFAQIDALTASFQNDVRNRVNVAFNQLPYNGTTQLFRTGWSHSPGAAPVGLVATAPDQLALRVVPEAYTWEEIFQAQTFPATAPFNSALSFFSEPTPGGQPKYGYCIEWLCSGVLVEGHFGAPTIATVYVRKCGGPGAQGYNESWTAFPD